MSSYNRIVRPELTIEPDPTNPDPDNRPSIGQEAFYHVLAISSDRRVLLFGARRLPKVVRASVTIMDTARKTTAIDDPARWAGWPEPIALVPIPGRGGTVLQPHVDPKELARQRSFDFEAPGQREQIDIALKIENQPEIHFWNNTSYRHGGIHSHLERHRLAPGEYDVRVTLRCAGQTWMRWFRLSNKGLSWRDVSLAPLP